MKVIRLIIEKNLFKEIEFYIDVEVLSMYIYRKITGFPSTLLMNHEYIINPILFFPMQVYPGETALAFYRAKNPTSKPIIGISTYTVVPFAAGQYFNKIQVSG